MANAIPPAMAHALPPAINEFAPFARASVFGDVRDLYRHAPTARIGANYTPSAHALFWSDREKRLPSRNAPAWRRTRRFYACPRLRTRPPWTRAAAFRRTGARADPRAAASVAPLERSFGRNDSKRRVVPQLRGDAKKERSRLAGHAVRGGRRFFRTRRVLGGGPREHHRFRGAAFSGRASSTDASTTAKRAPFEYTSARRKKSPTRWSGTSFTSSTVSRRTPQAKARRRTWHPPKQEWFGAHAGARAARAQGEHDPRQVRDAHPAVPGRDAGGPGSRRAVRRWWTTR